MHLVRAFKHPHAPSRTEVAPTLTAQSSVDFVHRPPGRQYLPRTVTRTALFLHALYLTKPPLSLFLNRCHQLPHRKRTCLVGARIPTPLPPPLRRVLTEDLSLTATKILLALQSAKTVRLSIFGLFGMCAPRLQQAQMLHLLCLFHDRGREEKASILILLSEYLSLPSVKPRPDAARPARHHHHSDPLVPRRVYQINRAP